MIKCKNRSVKRKCLRARDKRIGRFEEASLEEFRMSDVTSKDGNTGAAEDEKEKWVVHNEGN